MFNLHRVKTKQRGRKTVFHSLLTFDNMLNSELKCLTRQRTMFRNQV